MTLQAILLTGYPSLHRVLLKQYISDMSTIIPSDVVFTYVKDNLSILNSDYYYLIILRSIKNLIYNMLSIHHVILQSISTHKGWVPTLFAQLFYLYRFTFILKLTLLFIS